MLRVFNALAAEKADATVAQVCETGNIMHDMQADVIGSFKRDQALEPQTLPPPRKTYEEIQILVEGVDDHPHFAQLVCQELWRLNPALGKRSRPLPSFQQSVDKSRDNYRALWKLTTLF